MAPPELMDALCFKSSTVPGLSLTFLDGPVDRVSLASANHCSRSQIDYAPTTTTGLGAYVVHAMLLDHKSFLRHVLSRWCNKTRRKAVPANGGVYTFTNSHAQRPEECQSSRPLLRRMCCTPHHPVTMRKGKAVWSHVPDH